MLAIAKSNNKNSRASMQVRPGQPKNYVGLQLFCNIQTSYTKNPKQFNKQLTGNEYNAKTSQLLRNNNDQLSNALPKQ